MTRELNDMPGVQSLPVEGAMYAFPQAIAFLCGRSVRQVMTSLSKRSHYNVFCSSGARPPTCVDSAQTKQICEGLKGSSNLIPVFFCEVYLPQKFIREAESLGKAGTCHVIEFLAFALARRFTFGSNDAQVPKSITHSNKLRVQSRADLGKTLYAKQKFDKHWN